LKALLKHIEGAAQELGLTSRPIVVAVSGGRDSMLLLHALRHLPIQLIVAHVNYGFREKASEQDAAFVSAYCEKHALRFELLNLSGQYTPSLGNLQAWARNQRYAFFNQLRQQFEAAAIAVAHHHEDQAETILHQFLRGGGLASMRGMHDWKSGIWRPLLGLDQTEMSRLVREEGIAFRQDASNLKNTYTRNRIRNQVSPLLNEIAPGWQHQLTARGRWMSEVEQYLNEAVLSDRTWCKEIESNHYLIDLNALKGLPLMRYRLWHFLDSLAFSAACFEEILSLVSASNGRFFENKTWRVLREREHIRIVAWSHESEDSVFSLSLPEDPITVGQWRVSVRLFEEVQSRLSSHAVALRLSSLSFPIEIRNPQEGDRIQPFGMKGSKLVSRVLIGKKMEQYDKARVKVWTFGSMIYWLDGLMVSEQCRAQQGDPVLWIEKIDDNETF
jgi:tRNA(Ile)-lysidine synthase